MLTLQLTLDNKQITVRTDGQKSHSFSLLDLRQTDKEWKDFFKDPRPYGEKLFQALFKDDSEARKGFDELSKQTERTIVLVLESPELDSVAWEYAYHDKAYIVEDFVFMRALPEKERPQSNGRLSKNVERVPLLFIPANPLVDLSGEPMRELDIEGEWREMTQHIVKSNAPFDMIELRPATPTALQSVMARFQNGMITHFSGHAWRGNWSRRESHLRWGCSSICLIFLRRTSADSSTIIYRRDTQSPRRRGRRGAR